MARVEVHIVGFAAKLKKAVDEGISGLNRISAVAKQHEQKLKSIRLKSGLALTGEILAVRSLVKAYEKQEQADAKLAQAMKNRGIYTEESYQQTKAFADEMQNLTKYGNEEIEMAQTLIISVGKLEGDALKKATEATLDLAEAKGMDLKAAADLVSKSIGSTTNALSRYGIQIKEGVNDPTERANLIVTEISKTFGGQAQAAAKTYTGQLKQLGNIIGDLKEDLGQAILPLIMKFANFLREHLPTIRDWIQEHRTLVAVIMGGGIGGTGLIFALSQLALAFTNPVTGTIVLIAAAVAGIVLLVKWLKNLKNSAEELREMPISMKGFDEAVDKSREKIERIKDSIEAIQKGEAISTLTGKPVEMDRETVEKLQSLNQQLEEEEAWLKKIIKERERLAELMESITPEIEPEEEPEVKKPELPPTEIPQPELLTEAWEERSQILEEKFMEESMQYDDHYQELEDLMEQHLANMAGMDKRSAIERLKLAAQTGMGIFRIWMQSFANVQTMRLRFDKTMQLALVNSIIGMFNMMIDAAVDEVMADKIKHTAKLLMMGAWDWSALGKIALVAAAAGTAKGSLMALRGSLEGKITGKKFRYGGVLPESGWYYGEGGEQFFNPEEPVDSMLNIGGGMALHWHQYGPIRDREDLEEAYQEFGENIFYGQLGRRLAT